VRAHYDTSSSHTLPSVSTIAASKSPNVRDYAPWWAIGLQLVLAVGSCALLSSTQTASGTALLTFVVAQPLVLMVHELGHAAAGALVGMRPQAIRIFGGRSWLRFRLAGVTVVVGWKVLTGGIATTMPALNSSRRSRTAVMVAGGPISGFLIGALATAAATIAHGFVRGAESGLALAGCFISIVNLLPHTTKSIRGGSVPTDGLALLRLARPLSAEQLRLADIALALQLAVADNDQVDVQRIFVNNASDPLSLPMIYQAALRVGSFDTARVCAENLLTLMDSGTKPKVRATYHNFLAWACVLNTSESSLTTAWHHTDEALRLASDAAFYDTQAWVMLLRGRHAEAHRRFTTAYRGVGKYGDESRAVVATGLALTAERLGDHRLAKSWRWQANSLAIEAPLQIPGVLPITVAAKRSHTRTRLDRKIIARAHRRVPWPSFVLVGSASAYVAYKIGEHTWLLAISAVTVAFFAAAAHGFSLRFRA
jgi:hypothetical protein